MKPGGKLLFIELVMPKKFGIQKTLNFINLVWTESHQDVILIETMN